RRLSRRARVVILIAAALLMLATAAAATRLVIDLGGIRIEPQPTASSPTGAPLNGAAFGQPIDLARAADGGLPAHDPARARGTGPRVAHDRAPRGPRQRPDRDGVVPASGAAPDPGDAVRRLADRDPRDRRHLGEARRDPLRRAAGLRRLLDPGAA